jgi:hypothetical protein
MLPVLISVRGQVRLGGLGKFKISPHRGGVNAVQFVRAQCGPNTTSAQLHSIYRWKHYVTLLACLTTRHAAAPGTVLAGKETGSTALMRCKVE